jgi:hypothetical protein
MPELVNRITDDLQRRLEGFGPVVREAERLEVARQALGANGYRTELSDVTAGEASAS